VGELAKESARVRALIDWSVIRQEYEQGTSLRDIVAAHGSSIATISRVARHEGWEKPPEARTVKQMKRETSVPPSPVSLDSAESPQTIADLAIADLAKYLSGKEVVDAKLKLSEHKLFADSFSQYVRAKMLLPSDKPTASGIHAELLPYLSLDQLNELSELEARKEEVLAYARAEKLETEQGIKTLRKYESAG